MNRKERIHLFCQEIWKWYATHKRELPWRDLDIQDSTQRAYQILVSEIMLQQTQVPRVKIVYKRFLEQFPKITDLASASNAEVVLAWEGMGYNSRALRLRDCAQEIVSRGQFSTDMKEVLSLPGVGHYTAGAIRNFAFGIPTACIDTNIRRILHRTFVGMEYEDGSWEKNDAWLLDLANDVLNLAINEFPKSYKLKAKSSVAAEWHAALMDFGSLVCTKKNPKWDICPLAKKGISKSAYKKCRCGPLGRISKQKKEPGRMMGGKYIPNRIFRGKVVQELRDAHAQDASRSLEEIGNGICLDWHNEDHHPWLQKIVDKLVKDALVERRGEKYVLKD